MIKMENHLGEITISNTYFANLIGHIASETFGVAGLVSSTPAQGIRSLFSKKEIPDKGVSVRVSGTDLIIDLHIAVTYGVNISAIVKSIANKVSYTVQSVSGMNVSKVNVYVAEMRVD